jgi:S-adenosylmethionine:tRNA ribosyltransferase-isomerase
LFPIPSYNRLVRTADFDYNLPSELIAQNPAPERDKSRLLVLQRPLGTLAHQTFTNFIEHVRPGDVLVLNDSRVIPARLRGRNGQTGGSFELLLLEENARNDWWVMLRPGKRARPNTRIEFQDRHGDFTGLSAMIVDVNDEGHRRLQFLGTKNIIHELAQFGQIPLPPYIKRESPTALRADNERYQTVYATTDGSVAAPTAGLHFTPGLLEKLKERGAEICHVTLHVGLGTFAPVKTKALSSHIMHEERFSISPENADTINRARKESRRVIAVGTTSVRVLESAADADGRIAPMTGRTRIFIHPPYQFKIVNSLLTNFHLPCSTLLMLVSAFVAPGETRGRELILAAYAEAIREHYRFFSYGDAMLIL